MKRTQFHIICLTIISFFLVYNTSALFAAPSTSVYAVGVYDESTVDILLYADIRECSLISFGIKVRYIFSELSPVSVEKNENVWYLGTQENKTPYMIPDVSTAGEVVIIGGKLDTNNPTAGVAGSSVRLGSISFERISPDTPELSLRFGKEGYFKNFVSSTGLVLDDQVGGVQFLTVTLNTDEDADGLMDYDELEVYGTDQCNSDSDNDGLNDGIELDYWGVNWSSDPDGDGLVNILDSDSDNDGLSDGWEVEYNLNPAINDASGDADSDGYSNLEEYQKGTDPNDPNDPPFPWELFYPAFIKNK